MKNSGQIRLTKLLYQLYDILVFLFLNCTWSSFLASVSSFSLCSARQSDELSKQKEPHLHIFQYTSTPISWLSPPSSQPESLFKVTYSLTSLSLNILITLLLHFLIQSLFLLINIFIILTILFLLFSFSFSFHHFLMFINCILILLLCSLKQLPLPINLIAPHTLPKLSLSINLISILPIQLLLHLLILPCLQIIRIAFCTPTHHFTIKSTYIHQSKHLLQLLIRFLTLNLIKSTVLTPHFHLFVLTQ